MDSIDPACTFKRPDIDYLEHPQWDCVYGGAKNIIMLMNLNDRKYNFSTCLEKFSIMNWDAYQVFAKKENIKNGFL